MDDFSAESEEVQIIVVFPRMEDMENDELLAAKVRSQDERYGRELSFWDRLER